MTRGATSTIITTFQFKTREITTNIITSFAIGIMQLSLCSVYSFNQFKIFSQGHMWGQGLDHQHQKWADSSIPDHVFQDLLQHQNSKTVYFHFLVMMLHRYPKVFDLLLIYHLRCSFIVELCQYLHNVQNENINQNIIHM